MDNNKTYIVILRDSLVNKKRILKQLIELTKEQGILVKNGDATVDEFDGLLDEKGKQIGMLNMIDDGFENVYSRVREELMANPEEYQEILREIQTLISEDVELGATLEALERKNKEAIEAFIQKKKEEVRTYRSNKNSSKNYTKNMPNQYVQGESFFLDQKK